MYYEVKVRYINHELKNVTETILVLCEFFSEAEAIALRQYNGFDEPDVIAIRRSNIREVVNANESSKSYILTLKAIFVEDSGKEKATTYRVLLFAENMDDAKSSADEYIKQGFDDLLFVGIKESKIVYVAE